MGAGGFVRIFSFCFSESLRFAGKIELSGLGFGSPFSVPLREFRVSRQKLGLIVGI